MAVMPNRVRVVVVVSALAFAAGLLTLALLAKPTEAQGQTETTSDRTPFAFSTWNPYTGEDILGEGFIQGVFHFTEDAAGGTHFMFHGNFHGQGVGDSGAKYVLANPGNDPIKFSGFSESATTFTGTGTLVIIRKGEATPGDDYHMKYLVHFTFNANGEVTSVVIHDEEGECK